VLSSLDQALTKSVSINFKENALAQVNLKTIFWQGFLSDVLNPKVALFFLAFLPQFVDFGAGNETEQLLILGITGNVIAISINLTLVYFASAATVSLRRDQRLTRWLQRAMGATFIALGIRLANEKP
jgi:threonine/homoserine/homoserine lactone efflux protein